MFARLSIAFVALMGLNLTSAWHLTPEHVDGLYGIDVNENIELVLEANHTLLENAQKRSASSWLSSDRSSGKSHWKRQALPGGTVKCDNPYIAQRDLANCLVQAEAWCGLGTIGTGAKLTDYTAYAWKSNEVFLYICDWNWHWFYTGSTTCWSAEVAALIGLVENHCGYGSGKTSVQAGSYKLNDWNIEMGYNQLGLPGCPKLKGNNDGQGSNPAPTYLATALASGGPVSTAVPGPEPASASAVPSGAPGSSVAGPVIGASSLALFSASASVAPAPSSAPLAPSSIAPAPSSAPIASSAFASASVFASSSAILLGSY